MKKNTMMRIASVVLVAVLLTTCAISGTFAKYTTNATSEDSARVAAFGVEITANGTTFAKAYLDDVAVDGTGSVEVASEDNVVAPGTKGSLAQMTLTGTPEVDVNVTYVATVTLTGWEVDGAYYCPIVVKVNGTAVTAGATADEYAANIKAAIDGYSKSYNAGTDLSTVGTDSVAVTWEWAYTGDDAKDTALGDAAKAVIGLKITTTVTQADTNVAD